MDDVDTETSADAPLVVEPASEAAARPAHFGAPHRAAPTGSRGRRWWLPLLLVPAVLVLGLVVAWAIDTRSGNVPRNVQLAGSDIGGLSEDELVARVADTAAELEDTPMEL
jgi:hypothetical protein